MTETGYALCIVHYKDIDRASSLAEAATRWSLAPASTIVVDNSGDFPDSSNDPGVHVIRMATNVGYAAAVNRGLSVARECGFRYALVCTQDALLASDCAERLLLELCASRQTAVTGPVLRYLSAPSTLFSAGGILRRDGSVSHRHQGCPETSLRTLRSSSSVDWVDGAIQMLDLAKAEIVNDLDPDFFLYVEEVDFHYRLGKAGFQVRIVYSAHAKQEPGNYLTYLRYRNHLYLTIKNSGTLEPWPWRRVFLRDCARGLAGRAKFSPVEALKGISDARAGRMGDVR